MRNRDNDPIGVTARVGKHCPGAAKLLQDVVDAVMHEKKSLLLVGQPGAGKTTMLREISALISRPYGADDDYRHNVIVIDKSNEIAGDGDEPHPAIGNAVRHQVNIKRGVFFFVKLKSSFRFLWSMKTIKRKPCHTQYAIIRQLLSSLTK